MKFPSLIVLAFSLIITSCAAIDLPDLPAGESVQHTMTLNERIQAAEAYDNHGRPADAEVEYKAALLMSPDDMKILVNLIRISSALSHYDDAESYCHRALKLEPGRADVLHYLAWLAVKIRSDYPAAHKWIDGAIAGNTEQKPFYMASKALIFMDQAKYEEAVVAFQATLAAVPGSTMGGKSKAVLMIDTYKNLGRAYRNLGREQEAKESLRKALDLAAATNLPLTPE